MISEEKRKEAAEMAAEEAESLKGLREKDYAEDLAKLAGAWNDPAGEAFLRKAVLLEEHMKVTAEDLRYLSSLLSEREDSSAES